MFDIYVNGVDPERLDEFDAIRESVGQTLKVSGDDLDVIMSSGDHPVCIQKGVPENQAINIRKALNKLGLVCSYQQQKSLRWESLELHDIESNDEYFTCPACNEKHPLIDEAEPEKCPGCKVNIEKYRQQKKQDEEYEEIRLRMLRLAQSQRESEERNKEIEAERTRRQELEQRAVNELGLKPKWSFKAWFSNSEGKDNKKALLAGLLVAMAGAGFYLYSQQNASEAHDALQEAESAGIPEQISTAADVSPQPGAVVATGDIIDTPPTPNAQNLVVADGQTAGQASLAQVHDNATKFLNSMGIETKVPEGGSGSAPIEVPEPADIAANLTVVETTGNEPAGIPAMESTGNAAAANPEVVQKPTVALQTDDAQTWAQATAEGLFLQSMLALADHDVEWDRFVDTKIKSYLATGKLKSAYIASQYQTDLHAYLDNTNALLAQFNRLGRQDLIDPLLSKTIQRIKNQTPALQAVLNLQFGLQHYDANRKLTLITEAEKSAGLIENPVQQARTYAEMAYYQKRSGDVRSSDQYFLLAEAKLAAAEAGAEKIAAYLVLVENYTKSGSGLNAEIAMTQADLLLIQSEASLQKQANLSLLSLAYQLGNSTLIDKYASRIPDKTEQAKANFQTMLEKLKIATPPDFSQQLTALGAADFSAVAAALAAEFEPDAIKQQSLMIDAQHRLASISDNFANLIAASKLARSAQRLGKSEMAAALFEQAVKTAQSLPDKQQADQGLRLTALDQSRVFLTDLAVVTADLIQDEKIKTATLAAINSNQPLVQVLAAQ